MSVSMDEFITGTDEQDRPVAGRVHSVTRYPGGSVHCVEIMDDEYGRVTLWDNENDL